MDTCLSENFCVCCMHQICLWTWEQAHIDGTVDTPCWLKTYSGQDQSINFTKFCSNTSKRRKMHITLQFGVSGFMHWEVWVKYKSSLLCSSRGATTKGQKKKNEYWMWTHQPQTWEEITCSNRSSENVSSPLQVTLYIFPHICHISLHSVCIVFLPFFLLCLLSEEST